MFSQVSICPRGICHIACWDTPRADTPLGRHSPRQTPPCAVHARIRSISGRYASHWNAFFLFRIFRYANRVELWTTIQNKSDLLLWAAFTWLWRKQLWWLEKMWNRSGVSSKYSGSNVVEISLKRSDHHSKWSFLFNLDVSPVHFADIHRSKWDVNVSLHWLSFWFHYHHRR